MIVSVNAYNDDERVNVSVDIDLDQDFNPAMDGDAVRETLDIIICQDANVVDIEEVDLYTEAERVYQALKAKHAS